MRRSPLMPVLVLCVAILSACGGDDGGPAAGLPEDEDLQAMAVCAAGGINHLGLAIETSLVLFHGFEYDPTYVPPISVTYNSLTGAFNVTRVLDTAPGNLVVIEGVVAPVATVADGLQQHDNFTVTWAMWPHGVTEVSAAGSFRVIHNGLTLPPDQTETMRVTPAAAIWVGAEGACRTEFTQFELVVHHLLHVDEVRSASAGFVCSDAAADTLRGYMAAAAGSDLGTISGTYDGTTYTCSINLDNYVVDCSGD